MQVHKEIYLDNAATTQPYQEVTEVVSEAFRENWGNPSSSHAVGQKAKKSLEQSRALIADALKVSEEELYFTSGGTESNNLAITGACLAREGFSKSIITSELEHPSVTKTVRGLKRSGWNTEYIDAKKGAFNIEKVRDTLSSGTTLVTIMSVQNEMGFRFPIEEVARIRDAQAPEALLHTDAVQAFGKIPFYPHELGVDLASFSAHKIGGPKGIGALFVKKDTPMFTTAFGGGQEQGLRSGTEALPLIAGFAKAVEITMASREQTEQHARLLKEHLVRGLNAEFSGVTIHSRDDGSPFIVSFGIEGVYNEDALQYLSSKGIYLSVASACAINHTMVPKGTWRPKYPLSIQLAGISKKAQRNMFRVSFSRDNTLEDIDALLYNLGEFVKNNEKLCMSQNQAR